SCSANRRYSGKTRQHICARSLPHASPVPQRSTRRRFLPFRCQELPCHILRRSPGAALGLGQYSASYSCAFLSSKGSQRKNLCLDRAFIHAMWAGVPYIRTTNPGLQIRTSAPTNENQWHWLDCGDSSTRNEETWNLK